MITITTPGVVSVAHFFSDSQSLSPVQDRLRSTLKLKGRILIAGAICLRPLPLSRVNRRQYHGSSPRLTLLTHPWKILVLNLVNKCHFLIDVAFITSQKNGLVAVLETLYT